VCCAQAPPPAPAPRAPPPYVKAFIRFRDLELDSDPICELVEYATCQVCLAAPAQDVLREADVVR
jgi:hypothetical protein